MTLNIFFFTISINKRELFLNVAHREVVEKRMKESMDRYSQLMGRY